MCWYLLIGDDVVVWRWCCWLLVGVGWCWLVLVGGVCGLVVLVVGVFRCHDFDCCVLFLVVSLCELCAIWCWLLLFWCSYSSLL